MSFLGMGAAFWGIIAGVLAHALQNFRWKRALMAPLAQQQS
jgi:predicted benzoate:H+ symporter BenE